ncbi:MAG TPA: alpha-amylase family glycosyl hydrolase [Tepidiformaceae bacterium]|mgnify:FL=1|nr:alpha-amylase family glycosyl hydrolase [Tepidiformaceae bacterium]
MVKEDWWREAVVYQVYPRSFQDTNGDGIGDLEGIIARLDYLNDGTGRSLGIDAIWLSPTFPSPMADFGYDVSDYEGVHPDFGTMETMDRLIAECHRRGIKILLDWVPNHTSDQHPWFIESRSSRQSPRRDWYIWRDPKADGSLPNNWLSVFGGPAWTLDERTGQYYLHSFLKEQPDLNWRNPEVEAAMLDTLRFWFDRGIDGFRIDVMGMIIKHPELADNPLNGDWMPGDRERSSQLWQNNRNYPEVYETVKRIRAVFDEYPGRMGVGEVFGTAEEVARYYGDGDGDGLHLAFNFQFIHEGDHGLTAWDAGALRRIVNAAELSLPAGAQPCFALGNHDRPRFISRHNFDGRGRERARAAAILLLGLRNTPFIYCGEEIGMEDVDIPEERLRDPARIRTIGRDPERTPMQWDGSPGRGFSAAEPWLPYGDAACNVADQDGDPESLLSLYRRAIWLRRTTPALLRGSYRELPAPSGVFAWVRALPGERPVAVAVNTATTAREVSLPGGGTVILATHGSMEGTQLEGKLPLPPLAAAMVQAPRGWGSG